jgi:predicted acylesterase/phospholipase RssA
MRTRILSIDGGGIRGLIPASILAAFEAESGKRIHELFDVVVGTSTGGLIALALTTPGADGRSPRYSADDVVQLFQRRGREIFAPRWWRRVLPVRKAPYPSANLEAILREYFGDALLSQSLIEVGIPAYNIEQRRPHIFSSRVAKHENRQGQRTDDFYVRDIARATTAAPTYFMPACIFPVGREEHDADRQALVDGGLFANNPAFTALVEGLQTTNAGELGSFILVSIGTGSLTKGYLHKQAVKWGAVRWAPRIIDFVFDGVSDHVDDRLHRLFKQKNYFRFQAPLDNDTDALDDASPENILRLLGVSGRLINKQEAEIRRLLDELTKSESDSEPTRLISLASNSPSGQRASDAIAAIAKNTLQAIEKSHPSLTDKVLHELDELRNVSSTWSDGQTIVGGSDYHEMLKNVYESARATIQATVDLEFVREVWSDEFNERVMTAAHLSGARVTRIFVFNKRGDLDEKLLTMMRSQREAGVEVLAYFDDEDNTFTFSPDLSRAFTIVDGGDAIGVVESANRELPRARWYFRNDDRKEFFVKTFQRIAQASVSLSELDAWPRANAQGV